MSAYSQARQHPVTAPVSRAMKRARIIQLMQLPFPPLEDLKQLGRDGAGRLEHALDSIRPTGPRDKKLLDGAMAICLISDRVEELRVKTAGPDPLQGIRPPWKSYYVAPEQIRELARYYGLTQFNIIDDRVAPAFFQTLLRDGGYNVQRFKFSHIKQFWLSLVGVKKAQIRAEIFPRPHPASIAPVPNQINIPRDQWPEWAFRLEAQWKKDSAIIREEFWRRITVDEMAYFWEGVRAFEPTLNGPMDRHPLQHLFTVPVMHNGSTKHWRLSKLLPKRLPWIVITQDDHGTAEKELGLLRKFADLKFYYVHPKCLPLSWSVRATMRTREGLDRVLRPLQGIAESRGQSLTEYVRGCIGTEEAQTFRDILWSMNDQPAPHNCPTTSAYDLPIYEHSTSPDKLLTPRQIFDIPGGYQQLPSELKEAVFTEGMDSPPMSLMEEFLAGS